MSDGTLGFDRRTVLKTGGAGVASGSVDTFSAGADDRSGDGHGTAPNIRLYDTSGREHTFHVTIHRHPASGKEVTFDRTIEVRPRGEKTFSQGFGNHRHRHSATVRVDDGPRRRSEVTAVARHGRRHGALLKSGPEGSVTVGVVHAAPAEAN